MYWFCDRMWGGILFYDGVNFADVGVLGRMCMDWRRLCPYLDISDFGFSFRLVWWLGELNLKWYRKRTPAYCVICGVLFCRFTWKAWFSLPTWFTTAARFSCKKCFTKQWWFSNYINNILMLILSLTEKEKSLPVWPESSELIHISLKLLAIL